MQEEYYQLLILKKKFLKIKNLEKINLNNGNIEFKNVNFTYDEEDKVVLKNINLKFLVEK